MAKSRVAPLKKLTLPRLELQAAVVAVRLDATIREETTLELRETVFMTDSMIELEWVRSQARSFKPFVSDRVGEIQSKSNPQQWGHVSGNLVRSSFFELTNHHSNSCGKSRPLRRPNRKGGE